MLLVILQGRVVKGDQGFNRPQSAVIPPPPLSPVGLFFGFLSFQWGLTPGTSVWGVPAYGLLSLGHARLCVSDLHADCVHHPAAPPRNMCVERQNKQALTQPDLMMHSTVNEPVFQPLTTNQARTWVGKNEIRAHLHFWYKLIQTWCKTTQTLYYHIVAVDYQVLDKAALR